MELQTNKIGECATGDITLNDTLLLDQKALTNCIYRNEFGYVIYIPSPEDKEEKFKEMQELGFSEKFLEILQYACKKELRYLIIDRDANPCREEMDSSWDSAGVPTLLVQNEKDLTNHKPQVCEMDADIWKETTEEKFYKMLGALPPEILYGESFLVGEPIDHRHCQVSKEITPVFAGFTRAYTKYWESKEPVSLKEFKKIFWV